MTRVIETTSTEVRALLVMNPKIRDIEMLQSRFSGQLNVVLLKNGFTALYPESWMQQEFDEFTALLMTFQTQVIDLQRST